MAIFPGVPGLASSPYIIIWFGRKPVRITGSGMKFFAG